MSIPTKCPFDRKDFPHEIECYVCGLGVRRHLRSRCPYKQAREALGNVLEYLQDQAECRNKKTFADQRAGSDAQDLLPIVENALKWERNEA